MTPDPFLQVKSRGDRSRGQAISCSRCVDNDYAKGGIMNYTNGIDGAISQRSVGGSNGKAVHKENTKTCEVVTCSCPRSERKSAAS